MIQWSYLGWGPYRSAFLQSRFVPNPKRSPKCFQTLCLTMAFNHFQIISSKLLWSQCLLHKQLHFSKNGLCLLHQINDLMNNTTSFISCAITLQKSQLKKTNQTTQLHFYKPHIFLVLSWPILHLYSLPLIDLSCTFTASIIFDESNISWPCQWKISINLRRCHHLELICMS